MAPRVDSGNKRRTQVATTTNQGRGTRIQNTPPTRAVGQKDTAEDLTDQVRKAKDGDPQALARLEALAKQNEVLLQRLQALTNGGNPNPAPGPEPAPGPTPAPAPGPAPSPGPAPAPGPAPSGGCSNCGTQGAQGGGGTEQPGGKLLQLIMMILQLLLQKKDDQGGQDSAVTAGGTPGGLG